MTDEEWISVEDRLPPLNKWLILGNPERVDTGLFFDNQIEKMDNGQAYISGSLPQCSYLRMMVTHWMEIPEPPKKKR